MKKKIMGLFLVVIGMFLFTACGKQTNESAQYDIYKLAKQEGYTGTYEEWLASIKGADGKDGREIEVSIEENKIVWRYVGDAEWKEIYSVNDLIGPKGDKGEDGHTPTIEVGSNGNWFVDGKDTNIKAQGPKGEDGNNGQDGKPGTNGKSAYQIYLENNKNYKGTEKEWILDLVTGKLYNDYNKIESIKDTYVRICVGEELVLPSKVHVTYKDGTRELKSVIWDKENFTNTIPGERIISGSIDGYKYIASCIVRVVPYDTHEKYIDGYVNNILNNDEVIVSIKETDGTLYTTTTTGNGYYRFDNIKNGTYTVEVDAIGYHLTSGVKVEITDVEKEDKIFNNVKHVNFYLDDINDDGFIFEWDRTDVNDTDSTSSYVNKKTTVEFVDTNDLISDIGQAQALRDKYNLVLVDNEIKWSNELVDRFYTLYTSIPTNVTKDLKSKWILTNKHINNDIEYKLIEGVYTVTISMDALKNATPRVAIIEGEKGKYFSKRLYNAMVRFVTDGGTDADKCEEIMRTNFLTSFNCPDYTKLTQGITDEGPEHFQEFLPEEKLLILTMFEEMPEGMHKMKELKYVVRRASGHIHPLYPDAAAVTWTTANEPYIEFMETAFIDEIGYEHAKRLIIHEKTHMLWAHYFSNELKQKWCDLGGWYKTDKDKDGWATTKTTEFVSAYAHGINPDEDMAESVATYVCNPDLLKSRSINKYNFIKNYIMHGDSYLLSVQEDMTFEVYNLNPDYIYPGMIEKIRVEVTGKPFEDKNVHFTFYLKEGKNAGANTGFFRLLPRDVNPGENQYQFYDVQPMATNLEGTILEAYLTISKYSRSGYWYADQIKLKDEVGNERYESETNYQLKVYVDNPLEDLTPPEYVENTLAMKVENANNPDHPNEQTLVVTGQVKDKNDIKSISVRVLQEGTLKDSFDIYADYINQDTGQFEVRVPIQDFMSTGTYRVTTMFLTDIAKNQISFDFYDPTTEKNKIDITTVNEDKEGPTMDENNIGLKAVPTKPEAPDGETLVTLNLKITDTNSGFRIGFIKFLDPQGLIHEYWMYAKYTGTHTEYLPDYIDNSKPVDYEFNITLPSGSAPGTWGVMEITLIDYARNTTNYSFTEIIHFELIK